jgi:hypothetical protein
MVTISIPTLLSLLCITGLFVSILWLVGIIESLRLELRQLRKDTNRTIQESARLGQQPLVFEILNNSREILNTLKTNDKKKRQSQKAESSTNGFQNQTGQDDMSEPVDNSEATPEPYAIRTQANFDSENLEVPAFLRRRQ